MKKFIFPLLLTAAFFILMPSNAQAAAADEAVEWAEAQIGQTLGNGQCTRLAERYAMEFWGFELTTSPKDYPAIEVPGGWEKIEYSGGFIPAPGDIAVWLPGSGPWGRISESGHTAIIISATEERILSVDQNWSADGNGSPAQLVEHPYNSFWGVLRPSFGEPEPDVPLASEPDVPSAWAEWAVGAAVEARLVPESLQSKYSQAVTRADFCTIVVTLYENINGEITERKEFNDTDNADVEKAAAIGVFYGVGGNRFAPDAGMTREQAAVVLSRLAAALGLPLAESAPTFADSGGIVEWAYAAAGQVQAARIMSGIGNDRFDPKGDYTVEQCIVTILRLYDLVNRID